MTAIHLLAEWALRSSILILIGMLLLLLLQVKDSSTRLAAWTVLLAGSLAIPTLSLVAPSLPIIVMKRIPFQPGTPVIGGGAFPSPPNVVSRSGVKMPSRPVVQRLVNWVTVALLVYILVALALLLRLAIGLAMSLRLRRATRSTGRTAEEVDIRESDYLQAPVTLGIFRPAIVLPLDWPQWTGPRLNAVVAHEHSHIRRHDPAVQLISAIHRALLWHSPLSWFLHNRIVRVAEEVSDDAALAVTQDRAFYAEVLLDFIRRGVRRTSWLGVPMARYGRADRRIQRILDGTGFSRGVTRRVVAATVVLGSPLAYVIAAAHPESGSQTLTKASAAQIVTAASAPFKNAGESPQGGVAPVKPAVAQGAAEPVPQPAHDPQSIYGLGSVVAYTVTIKPRVEGQLLSVSFKEGDSVQTGQVLVSIDPSAYQFQLAEAEGQLARDKAQLTEVQFAKSTIPTQAFEAKLAQIEGDIKTNQAKIDNAKLQLTYTRIASPITGVAGLLLIDPGYVVHPTDSIVIINQLQPVAVVFNIAEDQLPIVLAVLRRSTALPVEAWDRNLKTKFATGRLTGVDNQIDQVTGTVKLKAMFDNKDHALFPNQFVNVRLVLRAE